MKQTDADQIRFVPNEIPLALVAGRRENVGKERLHARVILAAAGEVLSQDELRDLPDQRPRIIRHEHEGQSYVIEVSRDSAGVSLAVRPAQRAQAAPQRPAPAPAEPQRRPSGEMAAARAGGTGGAYVTTGARARSEEGGLGSTAYVATGAKARSDDASFAGVYVSSGAKARADESSSSFVATGARARADEPSHTGLELAAPPPSQSRAGRDAASVPPQRPSVERPAVGNPEHNSSAQMPRVQINEANARTNGAPERPAPRPGEPRKIDELLREMIGRRASDLHLSAGNCPVMRIDGEVHFCRDRPVLGPSDVFELVRDIMTDKSLNDFKELRDADFAYEVKGLARFRVNLFEDRLGVGAVLRQIPIDIIPADKLGLPKACIDLCYLSKGLVVVTGPTGSGKSTTLAAMVDYINKNRSDHIITIEDPVEFVHPNLKCLVNQREVGLHTRSFKNALRAALREDPDIVLVGEMRDLETISIAIETAETGHLVFGTLHTTTAVSTIDRIIDQFPTDRQAQVRVMLSESLKGVVAQVLCKKMGGGRVAAHEILLGTSAVSALVRDGKTFQLPSIMQTSKNAGMVTMNDSLFSLVQRKLVDPKEAYVKSVDKNGLVAMFKSAGFPTNFA